MTGTAVLLFVHDIGTISVRDTLDIHDKYLGAGSLVEGCLTRKEAVHYFSVDEREVIIPYHAIVGYTVDRFPREDAEPTDDFCKAMECPTAPMCD